MKSNDMSRSEIDQIILEEFPYPVALAYRRMLSADESAQRVHTCILAFDNWFRIAFLPVVVTQLFEPLGFINENNFNSEIDRLLNTYQLKYWLQLLRFILHAYRNHYNAFFFMPEIYELYWDLSGSEPCKRADDPWISLENFAQITENIQNERPNLDMLASELPTKLQEVMKKIHFHK